MGKTGVVLALLCAGGVWAQSPGWQPDLTRAYWYQAEPHAAFPPLPPVEQRLPALQPTGGPGNAGK